MTVTIKTLTLHEIRLQLREPFTISSGTISMRRILLLELTSMEGATAWAECVAGEMPNYSPETIDTCAFAIREWIALRVLGRTFDHPNDVSPELERNFRGHRMAKAAIEMGVWALSAIHDGVSLAEQIGGQREEIETGISLGIEPTPADLVERARAAFEEGYRKVKIKIQPGSDIEFLQAARDAVGSDAALMADANNAYTSADFDHLTRFDELNLMMIEQPLAWDDVVQHAELQKRMRTPICLDESITGCDRAADMIALGGGRIVNIKPGRVGGFSESIRIHDLCAKHGIPVWCGGMFESGIGRSYNVALASLPNFTLPGDLSPSARYWEQDIVTPEWTMDGEGRVKVPRSEPGIGVTVDVDRIADLTVRQETICESP
ncbi:MAG: o-succinylbenzoate synthase [Gemmatimonadetes bacterium]|nr:o-succinylbenzoate synthase [Gemmatimonadota bacterium]